MELNEFDWEMIQKIRDALAKVDYELVKELNRILRKIKREE